MLQNSLPFLRPSDLINCNGDPAHHACVQGEGSCRYSDGASYEGHWAAGLREVTCGRSV